MRTDLLWKGRIAMRAIGAIIAAQVAIGLRLAAAADTNNILTNSLNYREVLQCGPNSLFMFLILSRHSEVTLESLQNVPISSGGTPLLALRNAAKKFGVDAEICHYRPEEVNRIPLPAVGQFVSRETSLTPFHFDVIYKVDSSRVYLLDGTTGAELAILRSRLTNFWTGIAMSEKRSPARLAMQEGQTAFLAACLLIAEVFILRFCIQRKNRDAIKGEMIT